MYSELAIRIRGLGKVYNIFSRPEDRLKQMIWRGRRRYYQEFWALHDVDLDVFKGETVGIVGRNGSGKSTLLQLICGTLSPTRGVLACHGRIAALLELGAGFNSEFTGRENVFLNGAILGLGAEEIKERFDAIAAFADIGSFMDQPVKTYSSGMYARLAFSVAINVDPHILVVDEALSVGDEAFQRKCFARIHQIRENGATVLFVSHSAGAILELCDRAVLLDQGERLMTGPPKVVMAKYQKLAYAPPERAQDVREEIRGLDRDGMPVEAEERQRLPWTYIAPAMARESSSAYYDPNLKPASTVEYVPQGARIRNARILDENERDVNILASGAIYEYAYEVTFDRPTFGARFGMLIKTVSGMELGGQVSHPEGSGHPFAEAGETLSVRFRFRANLNPGTYFVNAGVLAWVDGSQIYLHRILDVLMFKIDHVPGNQITGYVDFVGSDFPACVITPLSAAPHSSVQGD